MKILKKFLTENTVYTTIHHSQNSARHEMHIIH